MFPPQRGQAGLEYMGMAVLITLGLILIGPYVIRSINAPYKAMEEGALDSQRENIRQAPVQGVTLPTCDCTDLIRQGCGDGTTCSILQAFWARSCGPVGCEADMMSRGIFSSMSECRNEAYPSPCCTAWAPTGNCGVLAVNAPGGRCNDGEMEMRRTCGSPTAVVEYSCQADAACIFSCQGLSTLATWCDPANYDKDLIAANTAVQYINNGTCGSYADKRCLAQCNPGYRAQGGGCILACGDGICDGSIGETVATCSADCHPPILMGYGCGECPAGVYGPVCDNFAQCFYACNLNGYWGSVDISFWLPGPTYTYYTNTPAPIPSVGQLNGAICQWHTGAPTPWKMLETPITQTCRFGAGGCGIGPSILSWTSNW